MSKLKAKRSRASEKFWEARNEKDAKRRVEIIRERKERGLMPVFANRTPSGNIHLVTDGEEIIDFGEHATDVCADEEVDTVHQSLEEISNRLDYKKPKIYSLMAFMFRLKGLHPGLKRPGKVLIHGY